MLSIWRENLVPNGRPDGVKGRCTAGASLTAKKAELGKKGEKKNKPFQKTNKICDTHGVKHALLCRATIQRRAGVLSLASATRDDDNGWGLPTFLGIQRHHTSQHIL